MVIDYERNIVIHDKGIGLLIVKGIGLLVMKGIGLLIRKGIRILGVKYCFS